MGKQRVEDLALFGGPPMFERDLFVGRPNLGDRDELKRRLDEILDRNWLSNHGETERRFEARVAKMLGVERCLAVCNATIGLELAIRATGLTGEVIVPSFTFVATAHSLRWLGITPVFCDVAPGSHNLDPAQVEELITERTSGILATHVWGVPCQIEALEEVARRHRLRLLFDAAHAFGCSHRGRMIGGFGDVEVFSFHATKFINSFEGGMIATDDAELASRLAPMRNFGFTGIDRVEHLGTNAKLTEVCAAMGLTSLDSMPRFLRANRDNYRAYREELAAARGITVLEYDSGEQCNYQYVVAEVDVARSGIDRDQLLSVLHAEHVQARRYFHPGCHRMEPYRTESPGAHLPRTERLTRRVLVLPTGTGVAADEARAIGALVRFVVDHATEVKRLVDSAAARPVELTGPGH